LNDWRQKRALETPARSLSFAFFQLVLLLRCLALGLDVREHEPIQYGVSRGMYSCSRLEVFAAKKFKGWRRNINPKPAWR
jgi:hypothetical protein